MFAPRESPSPCQLVLDFVEGLLTKFRYLSISARLDRQLSHSGDIGIIQNKLAARTLNSIQADAQVLRSFFIRDFSSSF